MANVFFSKEAGRATHMQRVLAAVSNARDEIFVVNWPATEPSRSGALDAVRKTYFQLLLQRCERDNVKYIRLLQIADHEKTSSAKKAISSGFDSLYCMHFEEMLDARARLAQRDHSDIVDLRVMPLVLPGHFVIVDRSYLSWEICEYGGNSAAPAGVWRSKWSLEIDGADQNVASGIRQVFEHWYRHKSRSVERYERHACEGGEVL